MILKSNENKRLESIEDTISLTQEMKDNYIWTENSTDIVEYIPLEDNPIMVSQVRAALKIASEVSDDTIIAQMGKDGTKVALGCYVDGKIAIYPVGLTAYNGLLKRLGVDCSVMRIGDTRNFDDVPANAKADVFNTLRKFAKGKSKILIGDEQVLADLSGDYTIIPYVDLIKTTVDTIGAEFTRVDFNSAEVSHEFMSMDYSFIDDDIQEEIEDALKKVFPAIKEVECHIGIASSDTGSMAATIYPYVRLDGKTDLMIGSPMKMNHIGEASVEKFAEMLKTVFASYMDSANKLNELADIHVNNPADTLYNIGSKALLPEKVLKEAVETFDTEYPIGCSAADVYIAVEEILQDSADKYSYSKVKILQMSENVMRAVKNISAYDYPAIKKVA